MATGLFPIPIRNDAGNRRKKLGSPLDGPFDTGYRQGLSGSEASRKPLLRPGHHSSLASTLFSFWPCRSVAIRVSGGVFKLDTRGRISIWHGKKARTSRSKISEGKGSLDAPARTSAATMPVSCRLRWAGFVIARAPGLWVTIVAKKRIGRRPGIGVADRRPAAYHSTRTSSRASRPPTLLRAGTAWKASAGRVGTDARP